VCRHIATVNRLLRNSCVGSCSTSIAPQLVVDDATSPLCRTMSLNHGSHCSTPVPVMRVFRRVNLKVACCHKQPRAKSMTPSLQYANTIADSARRVTVRGEASFCLSVVVVAAVCGELDRGSQPTLQHNLRTQSSPRTRSPLTWQQWSSSPTHQSGCGQCWERLARPIIG
jgi:hypothetical protein